jgi:23S rRNA pseudouridine1911/1915/1917 synthase
MRLDVYMAQYWPEYSRSQWQKYIAEGRVKVNGEVEKTVKTELGEDDQVTFDMPEKPSYEGQTLPVLYEDENVIVINKPAGILTHAKGAPLDEFTVAEFVRSRTTDKPESNRPGIVHRLDRGTSGVIICAKTSEAHSHLQRQFSNRNVKKHYVAVLSKTPKEPEAIIKLPIERNPKKPQTFRVGGQGKPAETRYKVREMLPDGKCLVDLYPQTGRTHQLRVHMAYMGAPVEGDRLYNPGSKAARPAWPAKADRMMLHAADLEITIPGSERKVFKAPLPEDMK